MKNEKTHIDVVNSPDHYKTGGIETIDFIEAKLTQEQFVGYCLGNVIKYVSRHEKKGGTCNDQLGKIATDLRKAEWYINRGIKSYENSEHWDVQLDMLDELRKGQE